VEELEHRTLPSVLLPRTTAPIPEAEPNETLDQAQMVGDLQPGGTIAVAGVIGNSPYGPADVDWYTFTLSASARVNFQTLDASNTASQNFAWSLYNNAPPFVDPTAPFGPRLLQQSPQGTSADLVLDPGTYFVAVSGAGNTTFSPFLADSGSEGQTGNYNLQLTATDPGLPAGAGLTVLGTDPSPTGPLDRSPLVIRLRLNEQVDPTTVIFDPSLTPDEQTVRLTYNPTGNFGDGNDVVLNITVSPGSFDAPSDEIRIVPESALAPGFYQVYVAGDSSAHPLVVHDLAANPLGLSDLTPQGSDYLFTFQINGIEGDTSGNPNANDTPAGAIGLGDLTQRGLVQVRGAIGDDPAYSPNASDPLLMFAGSDVDLYQFQVHGPGQQALIAEVDAGRIGSPLDPALSLFRLDATGALTFVASNDNTLNTTLATNGQIPLFTDAVLFAGLTEGTYYLAVSSSPNVFDPLAPPSAPVFDPSITHSGMGFSTGDYVLSILVQADTQPPTVVATIPSAWQILDAPPSLLTVQFSENVNLQQLAYLSGQQGQFDLASVFVEGADGKTYYPRFQSYDVQTRQATFLMLDALPQGVNILHLSGRAGLTDLAGNPLVGNDASGDYVVGFDVEGPPRGSPGNPLLWIEQGPNESFASPQDLGVLFPRELEKGVTITRNASPGASDTGDFFRFQVLQSRTYIFSLTGRGLPSGTKPHLQDATGKDLYLYPLAGGKQYSIDLPAGTYVVRVAGWTPAQAAGVSYSLTIKLAATTENPIPLTVGPAPAFRIRLGSDAPPATPPTTTPAGTPSSSPPPAGPSASSPPSLVLPLPPREVVPVSGSSSSGSILVFPPGVLSSLLQIPVGGVRTDGGNPPRTDTRLRLDLGGNRVVPASASNLSGGGDDEDEDLAGDGVPVPNGIVRRNTSKRQGPQSAEVGWSEILDSLFSNGTLRRYLGLLFGVLSTPELILPDFESVSPETSPEEPGPETGDPPSQMEDPWSVFAAVGVGCVALGGLRPLSFRTDPFTPTARTGRPPRPLS
jgi:hypothetical protein